MESGVWMFNRPYCVHARVCTCVITRGEPHARLRLLHHGKETPTPLLPPKWSRAGASPAPSCPMIRMGFNRDFGGSCSLFGHMQPFFLKLL